MTQPVAVPKWIKDIDENTHGTAVKLLEEFKDKVLALNEADRKFVAQQVRMPISRLFRQADDDVKAGRVEITITHHYANLLNKTAQDLKKSGSGQKDSAAHSLAADILNNYASRVRSPSPT